MKQPRYLTSSEVAVRLRKSPWTITRWCRTGRFADVAVQIGRGWLVPEPAVEALFDQPQEARA